MRIILQKISVQLMILEIFSEKEKYNFMKYRVLGDIRKPGS